MRNWKEGFALCIISFQKPLRKDVFARWARCPVVEQSLCLSAACSQWFQTVRPGQGRRAAERGTCRPPTLYASSDSGLDIKAALRRRRLYSQRGACADLADPGPAPFALRCSCDFVLAFICGLPQYSPHTQNQAVRTVGQPGYTSAIFASGVQLYEPILDRTGEGNLTG